MMESVLVVGFNARPLARSANKGGFRVLAVDFWGDLDLTEWVDGYFAILNQQADHRPERPIVPTAESLVKGAQQLLEREGPVDYIIISGGFDDHLEALNHLRKLGTLVGNTSEEMQKARDRSRTQEVAHRFGAFTPRSFEAEETQQFQWATNQLELPILVKPKYGSGGFHSRILRTEEDINYYTVRHQFSQRDPVLVQELIHGTDASVSLLSTIEDTMTLSVNEQLIGLPELGKGRSKGYCGNIVPLEASTKLIKKLSRISEDICHHLKLIGSNGIDYVIDKTGTPFLMEINPRIQATIEALELVSNINLATLHIDAWKGQLPTDTPSLHAYCARIIVYAKIPCEIPNLSNIPGVVDIPMPGSLADRGDPICTVNHIAASRNKALEGAWEIVNTIYKYIIPVTGQVETNSMS
jgi:predicted ATP-grasp superfamily ATP-dependent carboligase